MSDIFEGYLIVSFIKSIILLIGSIALIIILIKYFVKGKSIISYKNAYPSKQEFVKKHIKKFNVTLSILMVIIITVSFIYNLKHILDLPLIFKGEYKTTIIFTISEDTYNNDVKERSLKVKDSKTNNKFSITLISGPVKKDECLEIRYYPNIALGEVIKKCD